MNNRSTWCSIHSPGLILNVCILGKKWPPMRFSNAFLDWKCVHFVWTENGLICLFVFFARKLVIHCSADNKAGLVHPYRVSLVKNCRAHYEDPQLFSSSGWSRQLCVLKVSVFVPPREINLSLHMLTGKRARTEWFVLCSFCWVIYSIRMLILIIMMVNGYYAFVWERLPLPKFMFRPVDYPKAITITDHPNFSRCFVKGIFRSKYFALAYSVDMVSTLYQIYKTNEYLLYGNIVCLCAIVFFWGWYFI